MRWEEPTKQRQVRKKATCITLICEQTINNMVWYCNLLKLTWTFSQKSGKKGRRMAGVMGATKLAVLLCSGSRLSCIKLYENHFIVSVFFCMCMPHANRSSQLTINIRTLIYKNRLHFVDVVSISHDKQAANEEAINRTRKSGREWEKRANSVGAAPDGHEDNQFKFIRCAF